MHVFDVFAVLLEIFTSTCICDFRRHYLFHFLDRPFWFYYRCKESSFRMKFIFWSLNFLQYCCMTCFYHQLIIFWWSLTLTIYLDIFTNTFVQGILSFKVCFIIGESYLYSECNFKTSGWWLYKCWWLKITRG